MNEIAIKFEELLCRDELYTTVTQTLACMLIDMRSSAIRQVSGSAALLFGYSKEELIGRPMDILLPQENRAAHTELVRQYRASPTKRQMEDRRLPCLRKDGEEFTVIIWLIPVTVPADSQNVLCLFI